MTTDLAVFITPRQQWARDITAAWQSTVESILECGHLLSDAKASLLHGEFGAMIKRDLPFGPRTARRLMAIAGNPVLSNRTHVSVLPSSWGTLAELAKLPVQTLQTMIDHKQVRPEMQRAEVTQFLKKTRRVTRERELAEATVRASTALGSKLYAVIYADPPWRFEPRSRDTGMDRAADNHYSTMTLDGIKALTIPAADDCVLFLWATVPMLPQALDVLGAWGFTYRSHFIWLKDRIGTGYWTRNRHELLLIGTRGTIPAPVPGEQYESVITAPVREHSVKPFEFHEIIEDMFPGLPRFEMFARGERAGGWDRWGNEVDDAAA